MYRREVCGEMDILSEITQALDTLRAKKPLVHHITNYVTVNDCANITLAIGASPVMASDANEVADMVSLASSLVLNIGTLDSRSVEAMLIAGKRASELGIPIVFDPVGAGATPYRTETAHRILREVKVAVVRGNMSEIKTLSGLAVGTRGVDSIADDSNAEAVASELANRLGCVVAITGRVDVIAGRGQLCRIHNGHPMLAGVTGTGCMATSLIGSFCGVADSFTAAAAGVMTMGVAGEIARDRLTADEGIGMYRVRILDAVSGMSPQKLLSAGKIEGM